MLRRFLIWLGLMRNQEIILFPSRAYTETITSSDQENFEYAGVELILDVTAVAGMTLDVKVQKRDIASGKYIDIPGAAFTQKTGTGTDSLMISPAISEAYGRAVARVLGRMWRVIATIGGVGSINFSLGGVYFKT